jgi:cysteinyl-tRNA synthetase
MMLRLYNTLSKREEEFVPIDPAGRQVTFYSCGPTVYDYAHIGNFRSFLNADVLRRTLELLGFTVKHVMNITDVGHMTDDTSPDATGEDRMQVASRRLLEAKKAGTLPPGAPGTGHIDPTNPYAIADFYANAFLEDARTLGLKVATEVQKHPVDAAADPIHSADGRDGPAIDRAGARVRCLRWCGVFRCSVVS